MSPFYVAIMFIKTEHKALTAQARTSEVGRDMHILLVLLMWVFVCNYAENVLKLCMLNNGKVHNQGPLPERPNVVGNLGSYQLRLFFIWLVG